MTEWTERTYTYTTIRLEVDGVVANEKFFIDGRLPTPGDVVEMVYIGDDETGALRLQLRRRADT